MQFIEDLYTILDQEGKERVAPDVVFRDKTRLKTGQILAPSLALNLCASTCMVMVFIRPYLRDIRDASLWCSREFLAMERLEAMRQAMLPGDAARTNGLIVPVIYKDGDACPKKLLEGRLHMDFSEHERNALRLTEVPEARQQAKAIGRYVTDQYIALEPQGAELCKSCPGFQLPTVEEARCWRAGLDNPPDSDAPPSGDLP